MQRRTSAVFVALALALAGCGSNADLPANLRTADSHPTTHAADPSATAEPVKETPLRKGERRATLAMPAAYTPSAPYGSGTDDYRCFLLDPDLSKDEWLTGTTVQPGNPEVVHHVILFQVPPEQIEAAEAIDAEEDGQGWTCFGGTGLDEFQNVDDAPWIGAWAPGGEESVRKPGYGVKLLDRFVAGDLIVSDVLDGRARVWSDFRLHADGFGRLLIADRALRGFEGAQLVQRLQELAEADVARGIASAAGALDLAGRTDFAQLAGLGARAALVVGNDTGPVHLLAATGAPTLALFSGESDPALCAPRGRRVEVMRADPIADLEPAVVLRAALSLARPAPAP